jgi:hypothetical protein
MWAKAANSMKRIFALVLCISVFAGEELTSPTEIYAAKTAAETPIGPHIFGVFRGRTPCQELAELLNTPASDACNKVKCRLFLYQDPATKLPTTYEWFGKTKSTGKWTITKGTKADPTATVFRLEMADLKAQLNFLQVDENVIYVMDRNEIPLTGNLHFSYTLNRISRPQ